MNINKTTNAKHHLFPKIDSFKKKGKFFGKRGF